MAGWNCSPGRARRAAEPVADAGQSGCSLAFTITFAGRRGPTYSIRAGKGPFRNISLGGEHLHHYMWGIALLPGVGVVAVRGEERHRRHPAVSYGSGLALIAMSSPCCST